MPSFKSGAGKGGQCELATIPLVEGINIGFAEGEAVELRGRNGAGKSTFIKKKENEVASSYSVRVLFAAPNGASELTRRCDCFISDYRIPRRTVARSGPYRCIRARGIPRLF